MQVRLLGTAAGGGFPQWNCRCENCRVVRTGSPRAKPRSQSCVAFSGDGENWFLLNASPDVRLQIESFPALWPRQGVRGTGIAGVLLTNADLDHTLGLLILREGGRLAIHATATVQAALTHGAGFIPVLEHYCGVNWHLPPAELQPLPAADGSSSGLLYAAFPVPGKPPRYLEHRAAAAPEFNIGYRIHDERTGGRLLLLPDAGGIDDSVAEQLAQCDALLFDGTFWSDDEMQRMGAGEATASRMGHLPVGGPSGSLAVLAKLPIPRRIYVHLNNTNPLLLEDSAERHAVEQTGMEIGYDGYEFEVYTHRDHD